MDEGRQFREHDEKTGNTWLNNHQLLHAPPPPPQPFYGPFSGTTRVSRCQKRTSGLYCATEADTPTIRTGATPSRLTSAQLHHAPYFLPAGCPSCRPTNSVKAPKAEQVTARWKRYIICTTHVTVNGLVNVSHTTKRCQSNSD